MGSEPEQMRKLKSRLVLLTIAAAFLATNAWAAGCPAGTKRHCVQGKSGITCSCR
jgi:hypothetical protein